MEPLLSVRRRTLIGAASAATLASMPAVAASGAPLPMIRIAGVPVTRLIAGYNPIGGYSHSVPKLSAIMRNWFTVERTVEFLASLEPNGINTWQASVDPKAFTALRLARDAGVKINWICLMRDEEPAVWKQIRDLKPLAVVHHGEVTDRLFRAHQHSQVADFIRRAHDFGLPAGISSHVPAHIARAEESPWRHDFYMTCFYNIRRDQSTLSQSLGDLPVDELYLSKDPALMSAVVRQVHRPCLAFKILAAGRLCNNRPTLERAFRFAFDNIKSTDGVIVGMFPMLTDEVKEDAAIARQLLAGGSHGLS